MTIIAIVIFIFFLISQKDDIILNSHFKPCNSLKDHDKMVCKNNIALELVNLEKNISYCDYLDDKLLKVLDCKKDFIMEKSISEDNIDICNLVNDYETKSNCINNYYSLYSFSKDDISLCDKMSDSIQENICKNNYYFNNVLIKNISAFNCSNFIGDSMILSCEQFVNISISESEIKDCSSLTDFRFIDYCLKDFAILNE
ncbi:MAG: hypothetical protein KC589_04125 [Nanoarchaeota archaeon]|nr:hypothetical protein [Nanoarchaeota archaeon]